MGGLAQFFMSGVVCFALLRVIGLVPLSLPRVIGLMPLALPRVLDLVRLALLRVHCILHLLLVCDGFEPSSHGPFQIVVAKGQRGPLHGSADQCYSAHGGK